MHCTRLGSLKFFKFYEICSGLGFEYLHLANYCTSLLKKIVDYVKNPHSVKIYLYIFMEFMENLYTDKIQIVWNLFLDPSYNYNINILLNIFLKIIGQN